MKPETYWQSKVELQTKMLKLLDQGGWTNREQIENWILHYLEYDEPQIAYTNLVAMLVQAGDPINHTLYIDIVQLGEDLQITDGGTWDPKQAQEWWTRLKSLVK